MNCPRHVPDPPPVRLPPDARTRPLGVATFIAGDPRPPNTHSATASDTPRRACDARSDVGVRAQPVAAAAAAPAQARAAAAAATWVARTRVCELDRLIGWGGGNG